MSNQENIVTAAIIRKDNKVLIAQRNTDSWVEPNKWEFPGGKLEPNETYEACLVREIKEELGVTISIDRLFLRTTHTYMKQNVKFPITLIAYLTDWVAGEIQHIDCQDSRWVDSSDITLYDFAEADVPIVKKLLDTML
ncbi:MAG: (deoxy)nucleoside triphosphate pyrophosphohydrolase [Thermoplasmatota archaeon]